MPITYLNVRMKQRIGLASEWKADNPLLLKGELGIESDSGYVKSGDGSTRYNDLPYLTSPQAETGGKVVASIYQPESEMWIDVDMEDITIGAESDAFIEFK